MEIILSDEANHFDHREMADLIYEQIFKSSEGHELLHLYQGDIYYYNGIHYELLDSWKAIDLIYRLLGNVSYYKYSSAGRQLKSVPRSRSSVEGILHALKARVSATNDLEVVPCWLGDRSRLAREYVTLQNGILSVPDRHLMPHSAEFFNFNALPFEYEKSAACPQWEKFLGSTFEGDEESVDALRQMFGYILFGNREQQKIFQIVGPPRSGKSTIGKILENLMGVSLCATLSLDDLARNFGLQSAIGKRLAYFPDVRLSTEADHAVVVEKLLRVSGQDSITIDRKFKTPWRGRPDFQFLLISNDILKLQDVSGAFASRFIIIETAQSFLGRENTNIETQLCTELPGIFLWALRGWNEFLDRGVLLSPVSAQTKLDVMTEASSPIQSYLQERCAIGPEFTVTTKELYADWREWCLECGYQSGSTTSFGIKLHSVTKPEKRRVRTFSGLVYEYMGLGLLKSLPPEQREAIENERIAADNS